MSRSFHDDVPTLPGDSERRECYSAGDRVNALREDRLGQEDGMMQHLPNRLWRTGMEAGEVACMLVLVACGLIVATQMVGNSCQSSLTATARQIGWNDTTDTQRQPNDTRPATRSATTDALKDVAFKTSWQNMVTIAALAVASVLMFTRRPKRRTASSCETPRELPPSLQSLLLEKRATMRRILQQLGAADLGENLPIDPLMTKSITCVSPTTPFDQVAAMMTERQMRHLLVCNQRGTLLGIISDRDVHSRVGKTAGDIMTRNPMACTPETPVSQVISTMLVRRISCLPVVDNDVLKGIITTTDLVMAFQCHLRMLGEISLSLNANATDPEGNDLRHATH